jgi:hypothetical protein
MTKMTGLPSGQRLVWALQTLTKSGRVMTSTVLALLEITARSRAAASDAPRSKTATTRKMRWQSTLFLLQLHDNFEPLCLSRGHLLKVTKVMIEGESKRRGVSRAFKYKREILVYFFRVRFHDWVKRNVREEHIVRLGC